MNRTMNISNWITHHAAFSPDKIALRFEGQEIGYAAFAAQIDATTQLLQSRFKIEQGDRLAILSDNRPEYLALLFACARLGAMLVPLNWRLAVPEHLYILQNAAVRALFVEEAHVDLLEPLQDVLPACEIVGFDFTPQGGHQYELPLDAAESSIDVPGVDLDTPLLLVYTSGTTGRPKGAVLTQGALQWNAINSIHQHDMTSKDHIFTPLPFFHVGGLNNQTTPALHCGATVTIHRRFHPDRALQTISTERPTLTCLVPATMQACIASTLWDETDFSHLRVVVTGSTAVPQPLSDAFRQRGVCVLEMYGATETCPIAIYQRPDSDFGKRGSCGLPALHCLVKVVDDQGAEVANGVAGEILVQGPSIMREYWRDPSASEEALQNGWYHTGDIGYRDADGYYYINDRKKNMIVSGGENVYPAEVERVLYTHPAVQDVAIIGKADDRWGEVPIAFVISASGAKPTAQELRAFAGEQLARFKVPKEIHFVDELPRNAMGKIQHFKVRAQFL